MDPPLGEWYRMTRMAGPDCAVMCNLINIHTYIHTYIHACMFPFVAFDHSVAGLQ